MHAMVACASKAGVAMVLTAVVADFVGVESAQVPQPLFIFRNVQESIDGIHSYRVYYHA